MFIIKNIFAFLTASIVLLSSNGFILEQYFCSGCHSEHSEVAFFEFGELSHDHEECTDCVDNHHNCNCHQDDHLNNTKVTYIALDLLYFDNQDDENNSFANVLDIQLFDFPIITLDNLSINLREILKKPIDKHITLISKVYLAEISVFRL